MFKLRGTSRRQFTDRNKDVILGEDGYTNRSDNAPRNIFSLIGFALNILKSVSPSPTRAIEQFRDDRNKAQHWRLLRDEPIMDSAKVYAASELMLVIECCKPFGSSHSRFAEIERIVVRCEREQRANRPAEGLR